ncbi:MAG: metallophosphoesterase family protein [Bacillota bacterium]
MALKVFHTGDIHLGMQFNSYPSSVSDKLQEARTGVLERIVELANTEECNLLVVAGDLFNNTQVETKLVLNAVNIFDKFKGEAILFLPGNHDYDLGQENVWRTFARKATSRMLILNDFKPYDLEDYGLRATIYPAPCDSRHSSSNNLGWLKELDEAGNKINSNNYSIGIAHGALAGLSPDLTDNYFQMSRDELLAIEMDLWLLGHSHIQYPEGDNPTNKKIFNSGTPEPDGLDCRHAGFAWVITLDDNKYISARKVKTGRYRFYDLDKTINSQQDLQALKAELLAGSPENKIVRLKLSGGIKEEIYNQRQEFYDDLKYQLGYLDIEDDNLYIKLDHSKIEAEFTPGSFPYQFLTRLEDDEKSLHLAYELIKEVQDEA